MARLPFMMTLAVTALLASSASNPAGADPYNPGASGGKYQYGPYRAEDNPDSGSQAAPDDNADGPADDRDDGANAGQPPEDQSDGPPPKIGMEDRLIAMIPVAMAIPTQTTEMTAPKHLRGMPIVRRRETAKSRRPARPLDHRLATLTAIYPVSKSAPALRTEAFRMQSASMTRVVRRSKLGAARSPIASVRNFLTGAWRPENTSIAMPDRRDGSRLRRQCSAGARI